MVANTITPALGRQVGGHFEEFQDIQGCYTEILYQTKKEKKKQQNTSHLLCGKKASET